MGVLALSIDSLPAVLRVTNTWPNCDIASELRVEELFVIVTRRAMVSINTFGTLPHAGSSTLADDWITDANAVN